RRPSPHTVSGTPQRFFSTNRNAPARPQSFDREAAAVHNAIQRDGHFTPIVGNQRSGAGETGLHGSPQGRVAGEKPNMGKPNAGIRENGPNQNGPNPGGNQSWRRMGTPVQPSGAPREGSGISSPARPERGGGNVDWRRAPNSQIGSPARGASSNGPVDRPRA